MYFFSLKKLKKELQEAPLTEKQTLPYLIAWLASYTLSGQMTSWITSFAIGTDETRYNFWDYIGSTFSIIAIIIGTLWLFHKNHGDKGCYFIQRYLAIGWVASLRYMIFGSLLYVLIFIFLEQHGYNFDNSTGFNGVAFCLVLEVLYFWYLGKHIADVADTATYQNIES